MSRDLRLLLQERFQKAFHKAFTIENEIEISASTKENFGDYQCTTPMKLAASLGLAPRVIASKVIENLELTTPIKKIDIAGPGFINIHVDSDWISDTLTYIAKDDLENLGVTKTKIKERIICEFSSPNIAKEMHVGHLRSTIIGDAIANLLEFLGFDVLRLNHVGDFGTQFGMLIGYIKHFHPEKLDNLSEISLEELMQIYKKAKLEFDTSPSFKKEAQEEVPKLQAHEPLSVKVWQEICKISRRSFEAIYKLLNVKILERGESFYSPYLPLVVKECEDKELVTLDGEAKCIFLEGFINSEGNPLPLIIQKKDGGYNYATTDLAGFFYRTKEDKARRIIVVTDMGQSLHFQMVYQAALLAGYVDPTKVRFDHVPFGLVLAPNKKKFKTRAGETEKLTDLLEEAIIEAKALLEGRDVENLEEAATVLGIGAVKYADLSCNRIKDYTFSYERMLKFDGNTAAFILYAYVRIQSIKRKVNRLVNKEAKILLHHPTEISLGLHLLRFNEVLWTFYDDLLPHKLTDYLYHLAEKFHAFFRDCRVEGSSDEESRLLLLDLTAAVIKRGLDILGIKTLERM